MKRDGSIFLFGLGAPKAGTSWLHGYLAEHPEVSVPPMKELHFFNSVDGNLAGRLEKMDAKISKATTSERLSELQEIRSLLVDGSDAAYVAYMNSVADDQNVKADITPAYGLLSLKRLKQMQAMGESHFIYLMRDPVARLWSNIRMDAVREVKKSGGDLAQVCKTVFDRVMNGKSPALLERTDYAGTLAKIAKLDPTRVLVIFFEELFTNETVTRICDFLEITVVPALFGKRINEGQAVVLADADRIRAAKYLKPQYAAAQAHMGRLPAKWKQNAGVA
jgi:hypothetical protein